MVNDFHDERAIQGLAERSRRGEPIRRRVIGRVPRVPDEEDVVADLRNPVESQVEIHALRLVVVLHEAEKTGAWIEVVFDAARGEDSRETAARKLRRRDRKSTRLNSS